MINLHIEGTAVHVDMNDRDGGPRIDAQLCAGISQMLITFREELMRRGIHPRTVDAATEELLTNVCKNVYGNINAWIAGHTS